MHVADARRLYHHVVHGGALTARDVSRLVEAIEERDAQLQAAAQEAVDFYACDECGYHYMEDGVNCDCTPSRAARPLRHVRMAPVTAAPGIDLSVLRELADDWDNEAGSSNGSERDALRSCAKELRSALALIDASPKGAVHPDDLAVDAFAAAMKAKLAEARAKGRGGWNGDEPDMQQRLSNMLRDHIEKGDPRDVANFCMFLHQRGEGISPKGGSDVQIAELIAAATAVERADSEGELTDELMDTLRVARDAMQATSAEVGA